MLVHDVIADLRAYEKTQAAGSTGRANAKATRHTLERYSLGTTVLAGGVLNFNAGYASAWGAGTRTVVFAAGTITVS